MHGVNDTKVTKLQFSVRSNSRVNPEPIKLFFFNTPQVGRKLLLKGCNCTYNILLTYVSV